MKQFLTLFFISLFALSLNAQTKYPKKPVTKPKIIAKPTKPKPTAKPISRKPTPIISPLASKLPKGTYVTLTTDSGVIILKLYDSMPLHRDNFVKLIKEGFYDSLMFHRIIPGFMIQGGDPSSKYAKPDEMLGGGGGNLERIPAEFNSSFIHKKGALAAARDNNPEKKSSACQFYIVDGKPFTDDQLKSIETRNGKPYTQKQKEIYKTIGGAAQLDNNYTVFGETIYGIEVISKIAKAARNPRDRPLADIRMKIEILKQ